MSRISRESFIDQAAAGGGFDPSSLGADASAALAKAGIGAGDLSALAGADGKIDTHAELGRLFDLLDRVDHDGHFRSIETRTTGTDGRSVATVSGEAYDALTKDLATARSQATGSASPSRSSDEQMPSAREIKTSLDAMAAGGFSAIHLTPVKYRNQGDYPSHPYPTSPAQPGVARTIKSSGCAPCALAMADSALTGKPTKPETTAEYAVRHGLSGHPGGPGTERRNLVKDWGADHGERFTATKDLNVLAERIRAGGVAVVSVGVDPAQGTGHFTERSHAIVINGLAERNGELYFAVADPGRRYQDVPKGRLLGVDSEVVRIAGAKNDCGQVLISQSQLQKEMHESFILERGDRS